MTMFSSGSTIAYGARLPALRTMSDGALFFLTTSYLDAAGSPSNSSSAAIQRAAGLHLFSFLDDADSSLIGSQVGVGWREVVSLSALSGYLPTSGGTITPGGLSLVGGALSMLNAPLAITALNPLIALVESDQVSNSRAWTMSVDSTDFSIQARDDALSAQATPVFRLTRGGNGYLGANQILHSASSVNAATLGGYNSSYYLNATNINSGSLGVSFGGTGLTSFTGGALLYGTGSAIGLTAAGTAGFVLVSNGSAAPTWVNPSSFASTSASSLTNAQNFSITGDGSAPAVSFNGTNSVALSLTVTKINGQSATASSTASTVMLRDASGNSALNALSLTTTSSVVGGQISAASAGAIAYSAASHQFTGTMTVTGDFSSQGNVIAYSSDGRLKTNLQAIPNAVQKVQSLVGYSYDWDLEKCAEVGFKPAQLHEHGLIAQDVEKVMPDAVAPAPFNGEYKTVRYERLIALLVSAIAEQQKEIESLRAMVGATPFASNP